MDTITQRELRNNSAAVMDAVEAGKTYYITRNGVEVAELRPLSHRRKLTAEELVERHRSLPKVDFRALREDISVELTGEYLEDTDAWTRPRG